MKLLIYNHSSNLAGAERSCLELAKALKAKGFETMFVLPNGGAIEKHLIDQGHDFEVKYHPNWICKKREPGYRWDYYFKHRLKLIWSFIKKFRATFRDHLKLIKEYNPDWIIVNTSIIPLPIIAGLIARKKTILFTRESLFSENLSFTLLFPKTFICLVLSTSKKIIVPSFFLKKFLSKKLKLRKTMVLGNPISIELPEKAGLNFWENNIWRIGMIGYFCKGKGQLEVIEYFKLNPNPNYNLNLYGSGFEKINTVIAKPNGNFTTFPFMEDQKEMFDGFDVLINNGLDETFGRITIEAMRMKKLVFGRASGATPELIMHGVDGFLFNEIKEVFEILEGLRTNRGKHDIPEIIENGYIKSLQYMPAKIADRFVRILKK